MNTLTRSERNHKRKTRRAAVPAVAVAMMTMLLTFGACNSKDDPAEKNFGKDSSVAVTAFKLSDTDNSSKFRLDSVFFSIDLENGVIFNADSLPLGTNVTKLVPVISYPSSVSEAIITMEGGAVRTGDVDYKTSPSDSIDFSGNVFLKLTAQDGKTERTYRLKVNVHKVPSDSLMWTEVGTASLPSRTGAPTAQKSARSGDTVYTMVREDDGTLTLATTQNPGPDSWAKTAVTEPRTFDVRSFTATEGNFYILDDRGELYMSRDAKTWTATRQIWVSLLGGYNGVAIGIRSQNGQLLHTSYPVVHGEPALEPGFPVRESSALCSFTTKWNPNPIALLAGGTDVDGNAVGAVWAYDGYDWAQIASRSDMALRQPTLIPYYAIRAVPKGNTATELEMSAWLLTGGQRPDGTLNRDVLISYDNGVNWQRAVDYLQLPQELPSFRAADAVVLERDMSADVQDYWKARARLPHTLNGFDVSWQCPYIYLFGGYGEDGNFMARVRRGVLARLAFTPIF